MKTDTERTLEILKECGPKGCHSFDLNRLIGTTRSAARIQDLKELGWNITSQYERRGDSHGVRYFLNSSSIPVQERSKKPVKPIRYEIYTAENGERVARPIYA